MNPAGGYRSETRTDGSMEVAMDDKLRCLRRRHGRSSTAEEVTEGINGHHLTAIVTGATNGIGKETARVLALRGAEVIIPSRTMESGMRVKANLLEQNPSAKLHVMEMDLSSLDSVENFVRSFNSINKHLNILINNAGIMACPFQLSRDGIEMQFATNHLGHFLLTNLLLEKMKSTAKETGVQGRIINVSSTAHRRGHELPFSLDKLNDKSRQLGPISLSISHWTTNSDNWIRKLATSAISVYRPLQG